MKLWKKILLGVVAVIILFVAKTLIQSGSFKTIVPHFDGQITEVSGMVGVEDITIDQTTGIAFLSSDDRRATFAKKPTKGAIFMLNLKESATKPINLTTNFAENDFHPHGISLWKSPKNEWFLFVVNHLKDEAVVEIFQFLENKLVHKETIKDKEIISPNDIVGVGERSFYLTNDHNLQISTKRTLMDYAQIGSGNVCYFDGKTMAKMSEGILYANGINVSNDGKKLFVAATAARKVLVFDREIATGKLTEIDEMNLGTGVDNIELDNEGNLWLGCHPKLLAFLSHAKDSTALSPSQILKIKYESKGKFTAEELYLNDGKPISGSSVGAVYQNNILLIGSVFERKILVGRSDK